MGRMIDIDEFKRHTKNLADMAKKDNDKVNEGFFNGVLIYVEHYLNVFENINSKSHIE